MWTAMLLVAILALPNTAAAPFLQFGADAGNTGDTNDPGPSEYEIALNIRLPGESVPWAPVPIIDRSVYVLTRAFEPSTFGIERPDLDHNALWRVDVDTAQTEELVTFESRPAGLGSDGQRFFVMTQTAIQAHDVADGGLLWSVPEPAGPADLVQDPFEAMTEGPTREVVCASPAVSPDLLLVACARALHDDGPAESDLCVGDCPVHPAGSGPAVIHGLDPATGEVLWQWTSEDATDEGIVYDGRRATVPWRIVRSEDVVMLATQDTTRLAIITNEEGGGKENMIYFLDAGTGDTLQAYSDIDERERINGQEGSATYHSTPIDLLATPTSLYIAWDRIYAETNPGLEFLWDYRPPSSPSPDDLASQSVGIHTAFHAMAYARQTLYLARGHDLYALRAGELPDGDDRILWQARGPTDGEPVSTGDLVVARDRLFTVAIHDLEEDVFLTVVSTADGEELWKYQLTDRDAHYNPMTMGLGEGLWAVMSWKGELTIVGRTEASIRPGLSVSSHYPALEEPVHVDLSGSTPGLQGGELEYAAEWGDGGQTRWQPDPKLDHSYYSPGKHEAMFMVRNEHGQYATESATFDVDGTEPNVIETAFARENQDLTFGVLGLLVALMGGLYALYRRQRNRSRIARELRALERAFLEHRHDPIACEQALSERKVRMRELLARGRLDDTQFAVIDKRIDELAGESRASTVDDRFGFLSVSMARTLREMLADGRISDWEKSHFLDALDSDGHLTPGQKRKVRRQIEVWFGRDTGQAA